MAGELVSLDGFPLTGITREGVWKRLDEIEGWMESPEIKSDRADRVNGDGVVQSEIFYQSRLITYSGRVISKNHGYLHEAANRLVALPGRGKKKFVVDGHGPTQWAMVDPRGKVKLNFATDTYLSFQIPLEATDPFKYGVKRSYRTAVGTPVDVFHSGSMPAWPVATVNGSFQQGYELTLNGQLVQITRPLTSGKTHTVDMRTGILRENGTRVYGSVGIAEYLTVEPGRKQNFYAVANTGSGNVTLDVYDTYI